MLQPYEDHAYLFESLLKDADAHVRREAASALRSLRRRGLIQSSASCWMILISASLLLPRSPTSASDSGVGVLIDDLVTGGDETESVGLLKRLGGETALELLVPLLRDGRPQVRGIAADVLSAFADQHVIDALGELTADSEYFPRYKAATGLAAIGRPECLPHLLRFLADAHPNCAEAAFGGYLTVGIFRPGCQQSQIIHGSKY
jgi:HEAT repeat protein